MSMRGETFMVMSYPIPALPQLPQRLSRAEAEVVRLVVRGDSSEAIATARGTSIRTVANQLASIYRKLGVRSRIELATHLSRIA